MTVQEWWPRVPPGAQGWIVDHLGDVLPADVAEEVGAAGGRLAPIRFLGSEQTGYQLRHRDARVILRMMRDAA